MDELVSAEMDIAGRCKNTHKKIKKIFSGLKYFICQEELILSLPGLFIFLIPAVIVLNYFYRGSPNLRKQRFELALKFH